MKIVQAQKIKGQDWKYSSEKTVLLNPLVIIFADRFLLEDPIIIDDIRTQFPYEHLIFGSSAGEILGPFVSDESIAVTAIEFEKSHFVVNKANILDYQKDTVALGISLSKSLPKENLKHVLVISEGSFVNGSSIIEGMKVGLDPSVRLTGGICGDGPRFQKTLVSYQENPKVGEVVAIGLYGETLEISYASFGGWFPFGPDRRITKSFNNILYELDNKPALDIYIKYLGERASELPQSALLYPLNVMIPGKKIPVVRTILGIDYEKKAMILAGDVPVDSVVQLMMVSVDSISAGASEAARLAMLGRKTKPEFAFLVSCVGRKMVMDQRTEEEIEEVVEVIGEETKISGFYSYGEIAPFYGENTCELHNQTMTLTLISE
jgi:hypothetical protein